MTVPSKAALREAVEIAIIAIGASGRVIRAAGGSPDGHDRSEAVLRSWLASGLTEPGEPICKANCPCCGADLEIEHGEEEGEISVIGQGGNTGLTEPEREQARKVAANIREFAGRGDGDEDGSATVVPFAILDGWYATLSAVVDGKEEGDGR
jgi:hypothetical protein